MMNATAKRVALLIALTLMALSVGVSARRVVKWIPDIYNQPIYEACTREMVEAFNKKHPDITVEVMPGVDLDKLKTMIVTGVGPDVTHANFDYQALAAEGVIAPIEADMRRLGVNLRTEFVDSLMRAFEYEGQYYAISEQTDVRGLMWNEELLEKAGLPSATGPTTWDEFNAFTQRLTIIESDGRVKQVGFLPWIGNWSWMGVLFTFNGDYWDYETGRPDFVKPANVKALSWAQSIAQRVGTPGALGSEGFSPWGKSGSEFLQKNAMFIMHDFWPKQLKDYGVTARVNGAAIPYPEDGRNGTWSPGGAFVIPFSTPNPTEARLLLAFLASREAQAIKVRHAGLLSARKDMGSVYQGVLTPLQMRLAEQLAVTNWLRPFQGTLDAAMGPEFGKVINLQESPEEALEAAQRTAMARLTGLGFVRR